MPSFMLAVPAVLASLFAAATAEETPFVQGSVMPEFGKVADIETSFEVPEGMTLKLSYDLASPAKDGALNRDITKLARFVNMHGKGGLAPAPMELALVVHGGAVFDVMKEGRDGANANRALVEALLENGVRIAVCGQSAAAQGVAPEDLIDGVEMALSAMTAHAVLQAQGYALNPF
jgi:intracellular sulfur oxidation DsrE/DsrF family protein